VTNQTSLLRSRDYQILALNRTCSIWYQNLVPVSGTYVMGITCVELCQLVAVSEAAADTRDVRSFSPQLQQQQQQRQSKRPAGTSSRQAWRHSGRLQQLRAALPVCFVVCLRVCLSVCVALWLTTFASVSENASFDRHQHSTGRVVGSGHINRCPMAATTSSTSH